MCDGSKLLPDCEAGENKAGYAPGRGQDKPCRAASHRIISHRIVLCWSSSKSSMELRFDRLMIYPTLTMFIEENESKGIDNIFAMDF